MIFTATFAAAFAGMDLVPEEFATLQDAIDHGTEPVIRLGPGRWEGAVVTRPVAIVGEGAIVDRGVGVPGRAKAGLVLLGSASGTRIEGVHFDCTSPKLDLGVYGSAAKLGSVADTVEISRSRFTRCVQAVTNTGAPAPTCDTTEVSGGAWWSVHENVIDGLATRFDRGGSGGGIGMLFYNARGVDVWGNTFAGAVHDTPAFATTAVALAGCIDCTVADNTFAVEGGRFWYTAVNNLGARLPGSVASRNLVLFENDAWDDSAPWLGVSFVSRDSVATDADANVGVVYVDHEQCGDGALWSAED